MASGDAQRGEMPSPLQGAEQVQGVRRGGVEDLPTGTATRGGASTASLLLAFCTHLPGPGGEGPAFLADVVCVLFPTACPTAPSRVLSTQWALEKVPAVPIDDADSVFMLLIETR